MAFVETTEVNSFLLTSVEMSPDGQHLYAATLSGGIKRWDVDPSDGSLSNEQTLNLPYFSDPAGSRGIIGIVFDPTDPQKLWVTDNYPVPLEGRDNGVPDFSGRVSVITLGDGPNLTGTAQAYVTGLPRSNGDHVTNSLEFRANPDAGQSGEPIHLLYVIQGSNSAMGEADSAWGFRPERLLNAAVLEIDPSRTAPTGGFNVATEPLPTDGLNRRFADTDGDLKDDGIAINSGPFNGNFLHFNADGVATVRATASAASAIVPGGQFYDPFADGAVVRIFAEGQRNGYDLVWHSNGNLYVSANGSSAGGNVPNDPDTPQNEAINNVGVQDDYFFKVVEGGYSGHPNPLRDKFILNGGNPTPGTDPNEVGNYPVGTQPDEDYVVENAYSLGRNRSPNGAIEYKSGVFGSSLQNAVLFTEYSSGNDLRAMILDENGLVVGDFVLRDPNGQVITHVDPLDVIEGADGRLYLLTLDRSNGQSLIVRLDPAPGGEVSDTTADAGNDLALVVVDATDPAAVIFQVNGLDADIQTITVSFGGAVQTVSLDGQNRFVRDLSGQTGQVTATLVVEDDDDDTADASVSFTPGDEGGSQTIDAINFTVLSTLTGTAATLIRRIDAPSTYEPTSGNDAKGDGLNDNYDGIGYLDPNGGPEDKASFVYTAAAGGTYTPTRRSRLSISPGSGSASRRAATNPTSTRSGRSSGSATSSKG